MNQLTTELQQRGLNQEQIKSFYEFANKNPSEYGIDGAINMWQSVTQQPTETFHDMGSSNEGNPFDSIRQNQTVPKQAGILNGEQPVKKDDTQQMWESIMNAGSRAKVL